MDTKDTNKLARILTAPITASLGLFLLLTVMGFLVNSYYIFKFRGPELNAINSLLQIARAIVFAWMAMGIYTLLSRRSAIMARAFIGIVITLLGLNTLFDIITWNVYDSYFNLDHMAVLLGTNPAEASDFVSTYFTPEIAGAIFVTAIMFVVVYLTGRIFNDNFREKVMPAAFRRPFVALITVCLAGSLAFCIAAPDKIGAKTDLTAKVTQSLTYDFGHEVTAVVPELTASAAADTTGAPAQIVVVIGESLSSNHCSLYGYHKRTQPRLEALRDDSALVVFAKPEAPATHTVEVFKHIIGTWDGDETQNWYECPTFLQIASAAGYPTAWISNQSRKGMHDTPITTMSELADTAFWTNDGMQPTDLNKFDEAVMPLLSDRLDAIGPDGRGITVVHLLGSHLRYSYRYPAERTKFTPDMYGNLVDEQRETVSTYDNSVLYNDSLVARIMRMHEGCDALVLYFSDHAQDLYDVSDDYFGHARKGNAASEAAGRKIPMMAYMSPEMQRRHPRLAGHIRESADSAVNISDLTYTLMDIMGIEMQGHPEAASRSMIKAR